MIYSTIHNFSANTKPGAGQPHLENDWQSGDFGGLRASKPLYGCPVCKSYELATKDAYGKRSRNNK
ncbi:MAG: hypothetical protein KKA41_04875 [Proteobacteria bacterium]|nr:hypothetical protein [Pseudomonadota bacterium]